MKIKGLREVLRCDSSRGLAVVIRLGKEWNMRVMIEQLREVAG